MIAVLQLERLGDVAQSLPALRLLAAGGEEVALVVQERFVPLARRIAPPRVVVLGVAAEALAPLLAAAEAGRPGRRELAARGTALARSLGIGSPGLVVDLTWHGVGAALAAGLAGLERTVGPVLAPGGEILFRGFWATWPLAAVDARPRGRVPMTGVRRLLAAEGLARAARPVPPAPPVPRAGNPGGPVALVPGAGDRARRWPADRWAALAAHLARRGRPVLVLGAGEDRETAAEITAEAGGGPVRSLCGEVPLGELPGVIARCAALVAADTGPLHLASVLGVPVLGLYGGGAHAGDTGPERPGDVVIQALPAPRAGMESIPVEAVRAALDALLGEARWRPAPGEGRGFLTLRAREVVPGDGLGGCEYRPPGRPGAGPSTVARAVLAAFAAVPGHPGDPARVLARLQGEDPSAAARVEEALAGAAGLAREAAGLLRRALLDLRSGRAAGLPGRLRSLGDRLRAVERELAGEPALAPVGRMLSLLLDQVPPGGPEATLSAHEGIVHRLAAALDAATVPAGA